MRHFQKVVTPCLLALTLILPAAAQAQNSHFDLELTPIGGQQKFSGAVAIYLNKRGSETFAVRVDGPLEQGEIFHVYIVHQNGERQARVLMTCELGRASFRCEPGAVDPASVFPVDQITDFLVYYKGHRVLEAKSPWVDG